MRIFFSTFVKMIKKQIYIYFLFLALYNLFIALGFLAFLCGVYLLKNNSAVHRIALPVAVVSIFSFPAGTIAGGLYLWQRHENS